MINFNENDMKVIVKALLALPAGESYDVLKKIDTASEAKGDEAQLTLVESEN